MTKDWPLWLSAFALLLSIALVYGAVLGATKGSFVYPLDDTYIHMAMARAFAQNGTWGVSPRHFTSSSSSLLWTIVLSASYRLFGPHILIPLIINILAGLVLQFVLFRILKRQGFSNIALLLGSLFVLLISPLLPLIFAGIEHVLQLIITVLVIDASAAILTSEVINRRTAAALVCIAPLYVMTRYEGLFVLTPVIILLLVKKKRRLAFGTAAAAVMPILIYGAISVAKGWYFFPNSLLLKARNLDFFSFKGLVSLALTVTDAIRTTPHLSILLLANLILFVYAFRINKAFWDYPKIFVFIIVLSSLLHSGFANFGWFYRYEAYLVLSGGLALIIGIARLWKDGRKNFFGKRGQWPYGGVVGLLLVLSVLVPGSRGLKAAFQISPASKNIFEQQIQVATFLDRSFSGCAVGANDIGAINFFSRARCIDLWGLADMEVARAKKNGRVQPDFWRDLAQSRGIEVVVAFDSWFAPFGGFPHDWIKVGEWQIPDNVVCGDDTVAFYATRKEFAQKLLLGLKEYATHLPGDVIQKRRLD